MARTPPSRVSQTRILGELRLAAKKGDRAALSLALDQMRTLALSPRYWEKYLTLLRNPLARLIDLLAIKQGDRIAQQKGWKKLPGALSAPPQRDRPARPEPRAKRRPKPRPRWPRADDGGQPSLFDL